MRCIGCGKKIPSGSEIYVDHKLPGNIGVLRFFSHLDCAKDGTSPKLAAAIYDIHERAVAAAEVK
ncbi:MAG TPA: hypothetical protein VIG47_08340 [Gemmatimonadaceae bacterium]|jgi:hypothetical protein